MCSQSHHAPNACDYRCTIEQGFFKADLGANFATRFLGVTPRFGSAATAVVSILQLVFHSLKLLSYQHISYDYDESIIVVWMISTHY